LRAVTGWEDVSFEELQTVGERRLNLMRTFNAREGIDRKQDIVPEKLFKPLKGGPCDGFTINKEEFSAALDEYYRQAGWTSDGVPTAETLTNLDLEWATEHLPNS
jgi:aldehyde:ferredoxin oxidoreductase